MFENISSLRENISYAWLAAVGVETAATCGFVVSYHWSPADVIPRTRCLVKTQWYDDDTDDDKIICQNNSGSAGHLLILIIITGFFVAANIWKGITLFFCWDPWRDCGTGRREKYEIHKCYFGICQAGELAGFEAGRKHKSPQTVIAASACTHPECTNCIEMDNAHYAMHSPTALQKANWTQCER